MLDRLPGWVVSDAESVRAEVAEWRDLDRAQRWRLAQACSREALARLRQQARRDDERP